MTKAQNKHIEFSANFTFRLLLWLFTMPTTRYKRGPTTTHRFICPNCGIDIAFGPPAKKERKKSAKRVARGKRLAASLGRDSRGRFVSQEGTSTGTKRKSRGKGKEPSQGLSRFPKRF